MGFLDSAEEKAAALQKIEEAKKQAEALKLKAKNDKQDILAYEMGVTIKDRNVFERWKQNSTIQPLFFSLLGSMFGTAILFLVFKVFG